MQTILLVLLAAALLILAVRLGAKNRQIALQNQQLTDLQTQAEATKTAAQDSGQTQNDLWTLANTIHLYAALSEEEARTASLREKQAEILRASEAILQQIEK